MPPRPGSGHQGAVSHVLPPQSGQGNLLRLWSTDRPGWTHARGRLVSDLHRQAQSRALFGVRSYGTDSRSPQRVAGVLAVLAARTTRATTLLRVRADTEVHQEHPAGPDVLHLPPQDAAP